VDSARDEARMFGGRPIASAAVPAAEAAAAPDDERPAFEGHESHGRIAGRCDKVGASAHAQPLAVLLMAFMAAKP
jgi:hypothetical protein